MRQSEQESGRESCPDDKPDRDPRADTQASVQSVLIVLLTLLIYHSTFTAKADSCPGIGDEIATDRPDVTNSSIVVPAGSLQIENGVKLAETFRALQLEGHKLRDVLLNRTG